MATDQDFQPLLDVQQNQLGLTFSDSTSIDAKILAGLATNVAILLFMAQASLHFPSLWQHVLFLSPFLVSLILDGIATWPRRYLGASPNLDEHPEYLAMDRDTLLLQLLSDTELAISRNSRLNSTRWLFFAASIVFTVLGSIALFVIL